VLSGILCSGEDAALRTDFWRGLSTKKVDTPAAIEINPHSIVDGAFITHDPVSWDESTKQDYVESGKSLFAGVSYAQRHGLAERYEVTECMQVQFRAEVFSVFKRAQFSNPSGYFNNSVAGEFGYVTSARDPRIMQLAQSSCS
jgi:hypothetical protein